ncbi:WhiB family transcriptional regulator [Streptomyces sp. JB150]|uniref:WhiB family transcriptional regulator n=1 Tax=Streptomyces sp. JB150 TaxID=2714844 RepID=UPI00140896A9|nr:WhiB family transcriptional regulator [Streptomyces sp. JB150]QIJ62588.1 WhiB family transcriptional regulator [Streptomyces sp. JB150]
MGYTGSVPDTAARRLDWMGAAACLGQQEIFDDPDRVHEARIICVARCPVRSQCLAYTKECERGLHRDQRDGVAAGLTHDERHRLDDTAVHRKDDGDPIKLDGSERCGTHIALLRHLWLDEPIDPKCWSGEVFREHGNRNARQRAAPAPRPAPPETARPKRRPRPPAKGDTPHERRIYSLWSTGASDLDIARRMAVSVPSVLRVRERLGLIANQADRQAS